MKRLFVIIFIVCVFFVYFAVGSFPLYGEPSLNAGDDSASVDITEEEKPASEKGYTLLQSLEQKKIELETREKVVKEKEDYLLSLKEEIEHKISELSAIEASIKSLIESYKKTRDEKVKQLVKIYESMSAEEVAPLINRLDEDTAVSVIMLMKNKKAGQILAFLDPKLAVRISKRLTNK